MRILTLFTLLATQLVFSISLHAMSCSGALGNLILDIHMGTEEFNNEYWDKFKGGNGAEYLKNKEPYNVSLLGQGIMGSYVFRVTNKNTGNSEIVKIYKSTSSLENDLKAFQFLEQAINKEQTILNIPKHKRFSAKVMFIEDIQGTDAKSLLDEEMFFADRNLYAKVQNLLTEKMEQIYKALKKNPTSHFIQEPRLSSWTHHQLKFVIYNPKEDSEINFHLKPNNFTIDFQTHELWLINPF